MLKNDIQRETTQIQHKVELEFLRNALPNIATDKHTKFHDIPPLDDKVMLRTSKKCYENEDQMGE